MIKRYNQSIISYPSMLFRFLNIPAVIPHTTNHKRIFFDITTIMIVNFL